ncbi:MAG: PucR family transcriptional regulator ligand-binding domain-containing protein [Candidatus Promineifilaceae bacterium]
MLTIREALDLPVFASCQVVAGEGGLDNQIRWVHIVDIPDSTFAWHRKGVLLLTAGYGLRDHPENQENLIPILVKQGFAGMVLSTGYYFDHAPQVILDSADSSDFPVIEAPPDLLFIEVTETVLERIISRQYTLLQQSTDIFTQLTDLVLEGVNLDGLAKVLAELTERSVTIEDPTFRVLATAQHGRVDEAREQSVNNGQTPSDLAQHLLNEGIYDALLEKMEPLHVAPMPDFGMDMERVIMPIVVDRQIHGYIWLIAGDKPLTPLDEMAIRHGATVAALILFKEIAVQEAEEKQKGDFLDQLLRGEYEAVSFSEQARQLGFRLNRPHQIMLIVGLQMKNAATQPMINEITNWFRKQRRFPLVAWRDHYLVLILENSSSEKGKQLGDELVESLNHPALRLLVGLGNAYEASDNAHNPIRQSYDEAEEAIRISQAMGVDEGVIAFHNLGLLHWLYHLPSEKQADNLYLSYIRTLYDYDQERDADLVKTLETYLEHGGALVETAKMLFIHRNTLLHRLERIESICQIDLRDPLHRLNLYAAVKSYRLQGGLS